MNSEPICNLDLPTSPNPQPPKRYSAILLPPIFMKVYSLLLPFAKSPDNLNNGGVICTFSVLLRYSRKQCHNGLPAHSEFAINSHNS